MAKKKARKKRHPTNEFITVDDVNPKLDPNRAHMDNILLGAILPQDAIIQQRDAILSKPFFQGKPMTPETKRAITMLYDSSIKTSNSMRPLVCGYVDALIAAGEMPDDDTLNQMNRISLPQSLPDDLVEEFEQKQHARMTSLDQTFFAILPCFTSGVLTRDEDRIQQIFIWEVHSVNIQSHVIELSLRCEICCNGKRVPSVRIDHAFLQVIVMNDAYGWQIQNNEKTVSETLNMTVTKLSARRLKWTNADYQLWTNAIIRQARKVHQKYDPDFTNGVVQQAAIQEFLSYILTVNHVLGKRKTQKTTQSTDHPASQKPEIQLNTQTPQPEVKTDRIICGIRFSSVKAPRKPSMRTLVQYHTAAWSVKGHVRHYKSGKTVYIQPSVRRRQALKDKVSGQPAQQIVELVNPDKEASSDSCSS